ncbi:uncharacterized protein si:ch211-194k22.8 [Engraulis encrasicolus]|uniref:uncharacterized protein si:ch211-194k22.8 n=1 Tax=Engraulis encrasicolus TaxID=184585 RepID=UPI002FD179F1
MRRKTKAKRILDYENEEDEEEEQKLDATCHGLQKRRKQMYPAKENAEENSSSPVELQKFSTGAPDFDGPPANHFTDSSSSPEEADYLQSYSKMELITMVLCMQREMESLKEQIRCLTACGKLARHLESLIEKTQMWPASSRDSNGTTKPSVPGLPGLPSLASAVPVHIDTTTTGPHHGLLATPVLAPVPAPAVTAVSAILNGQWPKQESPPLKPLDASHHKNRVFTKFITPELLERCNTGTTAQKLTNDLLRGLYERDCLASHSISGVVYNKRGQPKPALPTDEVQAILRTVQYFFPGKTDAEIKGYIRQKLQNEAKRLRKKPSPPPPDIQDSKGSSVVTLSSLRTSSVSSSSGSSATGQRPSVD